MIIYHIVFDVRIVYTNRMQHLYTATLLGLTHAIISCVNVYEMYMTIFFTSRVNQLNHAPSKVRRTSQRELGVPELSQAYIRKYYKVTRMLLKYTVG